MNDFNSFYNYVSQYVVGEDDIIKLIYVAINAARNSKTVPALLLRGPPGAGKTMITQIVADYFNAHYVFIQTTINVTEDELIYKYIPSEQTRSGVRIQHGPLPDALVKSREKTTVLTIDEFDKTRPSADALLLDYLQNARVSFRIDDKEDVIIGDKNNLIVFITSNNNREFSEPLLRRVITIDFKLPDPKDVEKLLRKHFNDEKIIKTLTTIYIAGLTTELTKPITIQELIQLGHAMTVMPDVNFNQLLLSFVVKNVEDLYKLNESIKRLDRQVIQQQTELPDVGDAIAGTVNNITVQSQPQQQETTTVQQLLTRIKLPVDKIAQTVNTVDEVKDVTESTFNAAINTNTFNEYSRIVKIFRPQPDDRPDVLGKFKVVLDDTLRLTSDKPLTLEEVYRLPGRTGEKMTFEAYVEDYVYLPKGHNDVIDMVRGLYDDLEFTYYSKNTITAIHKSPDVKETYFVLRVDNVKGHLYKVKIYVNNQKVSDGVATRQNDLIDHLLRHYQLENILGHVLRENVTYQVNSIITGEYWKSENYERLINFINDTNDLIKLHAKITVGDENNVMISPLNDECYVEVRNDSYIDVERPTTVVFKFNNIRIFTNKDINIKVVDNVRKIVNKYVGEYDLIDGINAFSKMEQELKDYAESLCTKSRKR